MEGTRLCKALVLVAMCLPTSGSVGWCQDSSWRFVTASKEGTYWEVAKALSRYLPSNVGVSLETSEGSYANAAALAVGEADIALLQSDVAYLEYLRRDSFVALAPLYMEPIHILARRELGLTSLADLSTRPTEKPWKIILPPPDSGSVMHARLLLQRLDLDGKQAPRGSKSLSEALAAIRLREADLTFVTSITPHTGVMEAAQEGAITILELDRDLVAYLSERNPFFMPAEISYDSYPDMRRDVRTLGTEALLVVRPTVPEVVTEALLRAVSQLHDDPVWGKRLFSMPRIPRIIQSSPVPFHPRAEEFFLDLAPWTHLVAIWLERWLVPVLVLAAVLAFLSLLPRVGYVLHQYVLGWVIGFMVLVWLVGAGLMHFLEADKNTDFRTFGSSCVAILHYLFSGLESKYPVTREGTALSILLLVCGVIIVGVFTATLVRLVVARTLRIRRLRLKPSWPFRLRDHVVVVGWSHRVERLLRQLRSNDRVLPSPVVVMTRNAAEARVYGSGSLRNVWVVEGDASARETLERAQVDTASTALLLQDPENPELEGAGLVAVAHALESTRRAIHTVVEVTDDRTSEALDWVKVDEPVNASRLARRLLTQAVICPGVLAVYNELLTFGQGSQELYQAHVPQKVVGRTWTEAATTLADHPALLLGYRDQAGTVHFNPPRSRPADQPGSAGRRLTAEDRLMILADNPRALRRRWLRWPRRWPHRSCFDGESPVAHSMATDRKLVICDWSERAAHLVHQLRDPVVVARRTFDVTVIHDEMATSENPPADLSVVTGDAVHRDTLHRAGIPEADTLVLLAPVETRLSARAIDHRSLMICLSARNLAEEANHQLRIVAEVLDSRHQEQFRRIPGVEVVLVQEVVEKILAQAALQPHISELYMKLLTTDADSNEIYLTAVPESLIGVSFVEAYRVLLQGAEHEVVLLGFEAALEDGRRQVVLNPGRCRDGWWRTRSLRDRPLDPRDRLVVMAYREPAW